ncbi:hypothetical protein NQ176_g8227 [Zarea fungicola]|uniref:Uncharacterized protein n=1 Tax=Zarea fungicola TaxID=93591 RepID=A0ACC1MUD4_9HYPO|nr:hypothetical protein NQ176_g8227 [Lecanicillium fungicola]
MSQPRQREFTITAPQFSYVHLRLHTDASSGYDRVVLDDLLVKSYCTNALRQYLGLTGAAIPLDLLKVTGADCWLRIPRDDVKPFAAAITACRGSVENGTHCLLRIERCSDWLGTIVGSGSVEKLWHD